MAQDSTPKLSSDRLTRVLKDLAGSIEQAGTLVVLRTPPAAAQALARVIDQAALPGVAGTIAGDDTVFVAARSPRAASGLRRRFCAALRRDAAPPAKGNRT